MTETSESERVQALVAAAEMAEHLKHTNPVNGDGHNYALELMIGALDGLALSDAPSAAAKAVRAELSRKGEDLHRRLEAENAKRRSAEVPA